VQTAHLPSAGRRFLRILAFSVLQALLFGGVFGWLTSVRVQATEREEEGLERLPVSQRLGELLERLELVFYDWRARELGALGEASPELVPVVIDDETLANAREASRSELAMQPWPRSVLGELAQQLQREGATEVLVHPSLSDASPHRPAGATEPLADEEALRALLAEHPGRSVLGFTWTLRSILPPPGRPGPSFLALVDVKGSAADASEPVRRLLVRGFRAYVVPDGPRVQVLAGVASPLEAQEAQRLVGARTATAPRPFSSADRAFEVKPLDLLVQLAEVHVPGLAPEDLFQVRALEHPLVPLLGSQSGFGSVRLVPDGDGLVRRVPHLVTLRDSEGRPHLLPSLPLAAAMARAGSRQLRFHDGVLEVGNRFRIPLGRDGLALLAWDAPEVSRETRGTLGPPVNAWRVLTNAADVREGRPARYRNGLEGRAALLLRAGPGVATPVGGPVSEGAVLGQALANLLGSGGIQRARPEVDLATTMLLTFLGAFLSLASTRAVKSQGGALAYLLLAVVLGAGHVLVARHLFVERGLWVAVAGPLLAMGATFALTTLYALRTERQFGDVLTSALGRYISPDVLRRVRRDVSLLKPERRVMTVFFSDLEGFTRVAEQLPPASTVRLLNEYLDAMTQAVRETGGQVDKYMGDGLMAFWGAPVRDPRHAASACEAALRMREALQQRGPEWERRFGCKLVFRAGVNTGAVLVGDMGSQVKSAYTVLGEAVNLAARLEREGRAYGTLLLVGEETARQAGEAYLFREVDRVRAGERAEPLRVLELLGRREGAAPEGLQAWLAEWERALGAYHMRDFRGAMARFEACRTSGPGGEDSASALYLRRCEALLAAPPEEGWDGVFSARAG
jgi:adenylate cyclase